jgi:hypothetical protein
MDRGDDVWQAMEKLEKRIEELERRLARSSAVAPPLYRAFDIDGAAASQAALRLFPSPLTLSPDWEPMGDRPKARQQDE